MMNVNFVVSSIWSILYVPTVIIILSNLEKYEDKFVNMYLFYFMPIALTLSVLSYILERDSRLRFLQNK
jgi:hypothetical protein